MFMATEQKKSSNRQRRIWWEELLGIYRDERIDAINRVASRRYFFVLAIWLLGSSIYQLVRGDAWGWLVLGVVLLAIGYMAWQRWRTGPGPMDEWAAYQFNRQFLYPGTVLMFVPLAFWLLPVETAVDDSIWALGVAIPIFVSLGTQFARRAYPLRTWLLSLVLFVGGGLFGFLAGSEQISSQTIWIAGVAYAVVLIAISIYWLRSRKW